jgi:hypothetical protein
MRLWSVHPRYLDPTGLVACWREALLAQKVLGGGTKGYTAHPQLVRFRPHPGAIGDYLQGLADEADARGFRFHRELITTSRNETLKLPVTDGQVRHEWLHLLAKLELRSPALRSAQSLDTLPDAHPLFAIVPGDVENWERHSQ